MVEIRLTTLSLKIGISQLPTTENPAITWSVTTVDRSLGPKDIIVDLPEGATIVNVKAITLISIMNDSETEQELDLKLAVEGVTLFNQSNVIGLPAVNKTSASYLISVNASNEVTIDEQVVTLEAFVTLSEAASVRFQAQYYLSITYSSG